MHTTTVRFDSETWERLKQTSERLGIATAESSSTRFPRPITGG